MDFRLVKTKIVKTAKKKMVSSISKQTISKWTPTPSAIWIKSSLACMQIQEYELNYSFKWYCFLFAQFLISFQLFFSLFSFLCNLVCPSLTCLLPTRPHDEMLTHPSLQSQWQDISYTLQKLYTFLFCFHFPLVSVFENWPLDFRECLFLFFSSFTYILIFLPQKNPSPAGRSKITTAITENKKLKKTNTII